MKVWVLITGDGYYGGWFSGVWASKELAEQDILSRGWRRATGEDADDGEYYNRKEYLNGDLVETDMNTYLVR